MNMRGLGLYNELTQLTGQDRVPRDRRHTRAVQGIRVERLNWAKHIRLSSETRTKQIRNADSTHTRKFSRSIADGLRKNDVRNHVMSCLPQQLTFQPVRDHLQRRLPTRRCLPEHIVFVRGSNDATAKRPNNLWTELKKALRSSWQGQGHKSESPTTKKLGEGQWAPARLC